MSFNYDATVWPLTEETSLREFWLRELQSEAKPYWNGSDIRWWLWTIGPFALWREVKFALDAIRAWQVGSKKGFELLRRRCDDIAVKILTNVENIDRISNDEAYSSFFGEQPAFDIDRLAKPQRNNSPVTRQTVSLRRRSHYLPNK